jgi:hypothetical protein
VVTVLAGFDDFVLIKSLLDPMYSLLRAVIPTRVDPYLPIGIFPGTENLSHCGLVRIIWVYKVNPIP